MMYIKSTIRLIRYYMRIGISYHKYEEPDDVGGRIGWYEARGKRIAYRTNKGYLETRY